MAYASGNKDAARGLIPYRHAAGGAIRPNQHGEYEIADDYASAIYHNDPVKVDGNGRIQVAAASDRLIGSFAGVQYVAENGEVKFSNHWVASTSIKAGTTAKAFVYDDPNILFEIQADEDIEQADLGAMADIVYTAGDATTGVSKVELDSSNIGTGTTLKIVEIIPRAGNVLGTNTKVGVRISKHYLAGAMTAS